MDGVFAGAGFELFSCDDAVAKDFSGPRGRRPSAEAGAAIPEAWADTSTTDCAIEWECECECPCESSSAPRTRKVFSMTKNAEKPTKTPNLSSRKV